jgi:hypothetical protein
MIRSVCVLGVAALAGVAHADSLVLSTGAYSFGIGGEFNATITSGPVTALGLTGTGGSFETFCLEKSENFHPGGSYLFDVAVVAVGGGGGAGIGGDPLDERTAFLYNAFITGTLPGYDFSNGSGQRQAHAGALQNAIWYLEQEVATLDTPEANAFFAFSAGGIGQGLGDVRVANLYRIDEHGNRHEHQSQIFRVVPAPGAAALLGLGLAVVARRRRVMA